MGLSAIQDTSQLCAYPEVHEKVVLYYMYCLTGFWVCNWQSSSALILFLYIYVSLYCTLINLHELVHICKTHTFIQICTKILMEVTECFGLLLNIPFVPLCANVFYNLTLYSSTREIKPAIISPLPCFVLSSQLEFEQV